MWSSRSSFVVSFQRSQSNKMKVFALVLLVVGSSSAGSGPYLPSGWRPSGPAFYLPTETEKPAVPLKDALIQVEASGSDSLREYGPPKEEVSQDLTQQALPSPVTDQAFIIEAKFNDEDSSLAQVISLEEKTVAEEETATATIEETVGSQEEILNSQEISEEQTTEYEALIQAKSIETQTESAVVEEESTAKVLEVAEEIKAVAEEENAVEEVAQKLVEIVAEQQETENANSNIVTAIEAKEVNEEVKAEGVKNIAEALVNLENEIKAQQVQAIQDITEVRTIQETSGSLAPEGFLEYGPPGFTEYGPPKGDLRTVAVETVETVTEEKPSEAAWETNETRRRRFSPKFKTTKRIH